MKDCACHEPHVRRRIVLTGGPGAGKTAVLELIRQSLCKHLRILPEAAGILFGGGFPRGALASERRAAQRAIYFVQRELEASIESTDVAIALCDRGTVDGEAYWPGPEDLWASVGTTREAELRRYDAVIHLRTPGAREGYNHANPLRIELANEALAIDAKIAAAWESHPRRYTVESSAQFLDKASRAIATLREEMPACCRRHIEVSHRAQSYTRADGSAELAEVEQARGRGQGATENMSPSLSLVVLEPGGSRNQACAQTDAPPLKG